MNIPPPLSIAFYAGSCLPIHAHSLDERPLGGTETGLIRVAEVLSALGHSVTIYTSHKNPPVSTPQYLPAAAILQMQPVDVLITVKDWRPALQRLPAKRQLFWTGDGYEQFSNFGLGDKRVVNCLHGLLTASNWHADSLCAESGFPRERSFVVGNGVHLPFFEGQEIRNRKRLIYSSAPNRGLEYVPILYRELLKYHPDIELHIFAGLDIYNTDRPYAGPEVAQLQGISNVLRTLPNCIIHGNVTQRELARELMRSGIFFYPLKVPETCCISAMEAQAAGCVPIVSAMGALEETVGTAGIIVPGTPGSQDHLMSFLSGAHTLLSDERLWADLSAKGRARIFANNSWERIGERFNEILHTIC